MELTDEQLAVADAQVGVNSFCRIEARAGTGKTTSFAAYAERNMVPMLYLAFNKSVEVAAQGKFPSHVKCRTIHSLAYQAVGTAYGKPASNVRYYEVQKCYKVDVYAATLICKTLENFLNSADPELDVQHAEPDVRKRYAKDMRPVLVDCATDLWGRMCKGGDQRFGMTHSGYLKLYQLSKPKLYERTILLDEAQDTNPVTFDILEQQRRRGAKILLSGDPYQQIYSWRGAVNAMDFASTETTETLYLTQSFRFGPKIAETANSILLSFFDCVPVLGHPEIQDELTVTFPENEPFTIIARSNAEIFEQAATWTTRKKSVHFIGDQKFSQLVEGVMDVYYIYVGAHASVRDKSLCFIKDFYVLKNFAEDRMDNELLSRIDIVDRHKTAIPKLVDQIKNATVPEVAANVVLVTAHKAKGLEWDNVFLTSDYFELFSKEGGLKEFRDVVEAQQFDSESERNEALRDSIARDEINLLYVAATRAKKRLRINNELNKLMSYAKARGVLNQEATPPEQKPPQLKRLADLPRPDTRQTAAIGVKAPKPRPMPTSLLDGLEEEAEHSKHYGRYEENQF